jgi:hypothetical protein
MYFNFALILYISYKINQVTVSEQSADTGEKPATNATMPAPIAAVSTQKHMGATPIVQGDATDFSKSIRNHHGSL